MVSGSSGATRIKLQLRRGAAGRRVFSKRTGRARLEEEVLEAPQALDVRELSWSARQADT